MHQQVLRHRPHYEEKEHNKHKQHECSGTHGQQRAHVNAGDIRLAHIWRPRMTQEKQEMAQIVEDINEVMQEIK